MTVTDIATEFLFSGGDDYAEGQFISFADAILETRENTEEEVWKIAKSMIRASLYIIQDRHPVGYIEFLTYEVAKPALDEMDRVDAWIDRHLKEDDGQEDD